MKITTFFKYVTVLFISFAYSDSCLAANFNQKHSFEDFARAVAKVESSNNPKAYNSSERAIGIFQVRPGYFKDAQDFDKELAKYTHKDCYNPQIAKRVIWSYFMRYEPQALKNSNWEILSRLHNGGCGWRTKTGKVKSNLDTYWNKVKSNL